MIDVLRPRISNRWLAGPAALAAVVSMLISGVAAGAQTDGGSDLVVRSVDGRDPDAVGVEFVWTGDRDQVPDLVVRENGSIVESTTPVRLEEDADFGIVLAIDTSSSMEDNAAFERALDAAREFIANKEPTDQIAIVGFNDVVRVVSRFTDDAEALNASLGQLGVGGGTSIFDAVAESVNLFEGTDLVANVVLLTDGGDKDSALGESQTVALLGDANALLYAIGLESEGLDTGLLDRLTSTTGGSVLTSSSPAELSGLYADVQDRLRQQFRATFVSETEREGPSEITLTIGASSGNASYTPGARLDSTTAIQPVPIADNPGVDFLQSEVFAIVAVVFVLLAVAGAAFAIGTAVTRDRPALDSVLQPYSDGFVAPDGDEEDRLATSAILQRAVELTGEFAARQGVLSCIENMLERANLPLRAAEALFFYVVAVVILALLGGLALGGVLGGIVILVVAALVPPAVVVYLASKRRREFHEQLPDLLALLASTMRAGYSLMQGVEAAAQEVIEPTRRELQRVVTEAQLGMPLEEALHNVAERMDSRDFEWAVMAIGIQREVGGNLAELLDIVGETMRQRERLRRDINSLTAEGRVSAVVLGVLPVAIGLMIYTLNPDYIGSLFEQTIGWIMVVGAAILMGAGFFWMYKIIDIEV